MAPSISTVCGDFYEEDYRELKQHYNKCIAKGEVEFTWRGQTMLQSFARYLLEFLQPHFEKQKI